MNDDDDFNLGEDLGEEDGFDMTDSDLSGFSDTAPPDDAASDIEEAESIDFSDVFEPETGSVSADVEEAEELEEETAEAQEGSDAADAADTSALTEAEDVRDSGPAAPVDDITQTPEFQEWSAQMDFLDPASQIAVFKDAADRSPLETELADAALHAADYEPQLIFKTDETGAALRDSEGNFIMDNWRSAGSQAPDLTRMDENGDISLIEDKTYTNVNNLMHNIKEQTEARRACFGDDVDITYNIAPKFDVGDAEKLQKYCEDKLHVNINWAD